MKILFLDQSGKLGGAELCLADIAQQFSETSLVGVFAEGPFPDYLRGRSVSVNVLSDHALAVQKDSGLWAGVKSLNRLAPLVMTVARLAKQYDLIYANTQKALVVGAIASLISGRPLVYHLHDIVSADHFSLINRRIIVALANRAALVIANSQASCEAFIQTGGKAEKVHVIYNGFNLETYRTTHQASLRNDLTPSMAFSKEAPPFIVGHFSRLSPWKGQHVLIEALQYCPENVVAVLVGDALFGEQNYVSQLYQQIKCLHLEHRVHFLGFRSDIPQLMAACDLVTHTSTAPEPLGRVIVEAMLCGTPAVAAAAGGAVELIDHGQTGWLTPPGNVQKLAEVINTCQRDPSRAQVLAQTAQTRAYQRFSLETTNAKIAQLLKETINLSHGPQPVS
ncbi:MAG: glycosyltransferase [Cyanobacteria bacterium P01_H01_bin.21]